MRSLPAVNRGFIELLSSEPPQLTTSRLRSCLCQKVSLEGLRCLAIRMWGSLGIFPPAQFGCLPPQATDIREPRHPVTTFVDHWPKCRILMFGFTSRPSLHPKITLPTCQPQLPGTSLGRETRLAEYCRRPRRELRQRCTHEPKNQGHRAPELGELR